MDPRTNQKIIRIGSFLWATVNAGLRLLRSAFMPKDRLPCPVISVGNLQAGGTGKTPFVIVLAERLQKVGIQVGVIVRGYKSQTEADGLIRIYGPNDPVESADLMGDEPREIKLAVPHIWIGVGPNRVLSSRQMIDASIRAKSPVQLILLDDAFQNFSIERNVDFLLVTSARFGQTWFRDFPVFWLRRSKAIVVWTKGGDWPYPERKPDLRFSYQIRLPDLSAPWVLVTGLAEGGILKMDLEAKGVTIEKWFEYPDHHPFEEKNYWIWKETLDSVRGSRLLFTRKDAQKLAPLLQALGESRYQVLLADFAPHEKSSEKLLDTWVQFWRKRILDKN